MLYGPIISAEPATSSQQQRTPGLCAAYLARAGALLFSVGVADSVCL